ncbi:ATP-binding protein [Actinoallomurus sp. CA-142502]|uniref:ATP-binding protein n=1 Tax=Actinoallomurus sp. CA-142502 TaxID=3239885 RepID=UPI003D8D5242
MDSRTLSYQRRNERADRMYFKAHVKKCFADRRVSRYLELGLVDSSEVSTALAEGDAFDQARSTAVHHMYNVERDDRNAFREAVRFVLDHSLDARTGALATALPLALFFSAVEAFGEDGFRRLSVTLVSALILAAAGLLFARSRVVAGAVAAVGISLAVGPHYLAGLEWNPATSVFCCLVGVAAGVHLADELRRLALWQVFALPLLVALRMLHDFREEQLRREWIDGTTEDIVVPQIILSINTTLGKDHDRLLVEEDSEGLRRLHDPALTVSTRSEQRIRGTLARYDGGSIALSGPRGVGKSTLLRMFCAPPEGSGGEFAVYVSAPAEYVPRDFLIDLFQRLSEDYLTYQGHTYDDPLKKRFVARRRVARVVREVSSAALRSALALGLLALLIWSVVEDVRPAVVRFDHAHVDGWYDSVIAFAGHWWAAHRGLTQILGIILVSIIWPGTRRWRWHREPSLVVKARENLFRLQAERTVTWGANAGLPALLGGSLSLNRGASVKHVPWALPELVGQMRRFMTQVAQDEKESGRRVLIGIDEIDRIGSTEHAERFISEIKAIFGIENCFFLVSVAEDVGSTFARRVVSERSVFENAFDDVVIVDPLTLEESKNLLLRRVPGFTDAFVYLAHALSGGVPRELIRITRRLVELNEEMRATSDYPRLEDLTRALVKEGLIEVVTATRNMIAQLAPEAPWGVTFDQLRNLLTAMRTEPSVAISESAALMRRLASLDADRAAPETDSALTEADPLKAARRALMELSAFTYFSVTIIDAFADLTFNLNKAKAGGSPTDAGSYEQLAGARRELTLSPESSRETVRRFREAWSLDDQA